MIWNLPEVMRVAYVFMFVVLLWMALWSFGAAGVVASSMGDGGRWWLLVVSWQVFFFILSCSCSNWFWHQITRLPASDYAVVAIHVCRFSL